MKTPKQGEANVAVKGAEDQVIEDVLSLV